MQSMVAKRSPKQLQNWVAKSLKAIHSVGLLGDLVDPVEAQEALAEAYGPIDLGDDDLLIRFATLDRERVWQGPLFSLDELPRLEEAKHYSWLLRAWAGISQGAFAPTKISESWKGGVCTLRFTASGRQHVLELENQGWVDVGVLLELNKVIAKSKRQFVLVSHLDLDSVVLCLTAKERAALVKAYGPVNDIRADRKMYRERAVEYQTDWGFDALRSGELDQAVAFFERAEAFAGTRTPKLREGWCHAFQMNGDSRALAAEAKAWASKEPKRVEPWQFAAVAASRSGKHQDALASIDRAITVAPRVGGLHHHRACVLVELGRLDDAVLAVKKAVTLDPEAKAALAKDADLKPIRARVKALIATR